MKLIYLFNSEGEEEEKEEEEEEVVEKDTNRSIVAGRWKQNS